MPQAKGTDPEHENTGARYPIRGTFFGCWAAAVNAAARMKRMMGAMKGSLSLIISLLFAQTRMSLALELDSLSDAILVKSNY